MASLGWPLRLSSPGSSGLFAFSVEVCPLKSRVVPLKANRRGRMSLKKTASLFFVALLVVFLLHTRTGRELLLPEAEEERKARRIEKLKKKTARIISRNRDLVAIQLFSGSCLCGYIQRSRSDFLELVTEATGTKTNINWTLIRKISPFHHTSIATFMLVLAASAIGAFWLSQ
jgi:hypothetical protein